MNERTLILSSNLVDQLEQTAQRQGQSIETFLAQVLANYVSSSPQSNWALVLAEAMEVAPIQWLDDPLASTTSRQDFQNAMYQRWMAQQTQESANDDDA